MDTRWCFLLIALVTSQVNGGIPKDTSSPSIIQHVRAPGSKVVGGWPAQETQFPHQVNIRMVNVLGTVSTCGGSMMNNEWIVTAAHCVANQVSFVVRLGLTNLTRPEYIIDTTSYFVHPQYVEAVGGVQTHDIALMHLETSVPYSRTIQPVRLQPEFQFTDRYVGEVLTVSGFGLTDDAINGGATSEILLWTHLRGITNDECRWWYSGSSIIQDVTICAEYYNHTSQSACSGDSGGPLTYIDKDGRPTQIGIVSFVSSAGCNSAFPSAYVRPGHYHDWYRIITGYNFDWTTDDYKEEDDNHDEVATAPPPGDEHEDDDVGVATVPPSDDHDDAGVATLPPSGGDDDEEDIGADSDEDDEEDDIGVPTLPPIDIQTPGEDSDEEGSGFIFISDF